MHIFAETKASRPRPIVNINKSHNMGRTVTVQKDNTNGSVIKTREVIIVFGSVTQGWSIPISAIPVFPGASCVIGHEPSAHHTYITVLVTLVHKIGSHVKGTCIGSIFL